MKFPYHFAVVFSLAASVSLASCSVARRVHTAKSTTIACEVTQMPTVAELEVLPEQVKADISWVNHTFKGSISRKTQTEELVAQILSGAQADVLVEPKISHESRRHWFRSNHTLSVSGYPARFKAFRTASLDDIAKLNAMKEPAQPSVTVKVVETLRPVTETPPARTSLVKRADPFKSPAEHPERKFRRKTGYRGFVHGGYIAGIDEDWGDGYGFSTTHGYQFHPRLFAGIGAGFYKLSDYRSDSNGKGEMLPVYVSLRSDLLKRRLSPFIEIRGGGQLLDAQSYYVGGSIGFSVGHIDLGAEYARIGSVGNSFGVRLGFSF